MSNKGLVKFDCFKAYEESTKYRNGADTIIIRTIYHYATLIYNANGPLPQQSVDGNYYNVPDPLTAEVVDVFLEKIEINVEDEKARAIYERGSVDISIVDFEKILKFNKFEASVYQVIYGKGTARIDKWV